MKKCFITFVAFSAAILAGCSKFNTETIDSVQTFSACIGDVTKTTLSGGKVFWEVDDEILVNGVAFLATPDENNQAKATFRKADPFGPDAEPDSNGMYVATFACSFDSESGKGTIPDAVTFSGTDAIQAPMIAMGSSTELFFKNICSVIEVTLKGSETVQRIELSANGKALSGEFTIPDGQTAVMSETFGSAALEFGAGFPLDSKGSVFRIAVPAGSYDGLNIKVTDIACRAWQKTAGKTATTVANTIYKLSFTPSFPSVVDGALEGVYSIDSKGTRVNFAKGNLYHSSEKGWYFADSQTDIPKAGWSANSPVTHFFWTDEAAVAISGSYDMEHEDTGSEVFFTNKDDFKVYGNSDWRALSLDEWDYLLNGRTFTSKNLKGEGYSYLRVILYESGVYGLLLFPDGYSGQEEIRLGKYIPDGCAFLPCAGISLFGKGVGENVSGAYWIADADATLAKALAFGAGNVSIGTGTNKYNGLSVRLATVVK